MTPLGYGATLVTRDEWGAREPRSIQRLASGMVTSHWEGPHMGDFPHESCSGKVRGIQAYHMDSKGWNDIAYNAVACPHGYVFEGRGPGVRSAANGTSAGNNGAYAVCYLGGEGDPFTEGGQRAVKAAGDWLTFPGSARNAHRDWKPTQCPGDDIYEWTHDGQPVTWPPSPTGRSTKVLDICTHPDGTRVDMVCIGPDKSVFHYWGLTPDAWLEVENIGQIRSNLGGIAKAVSCAYWGDDLTVVAQGANNGVWMNRFVQSDGAWTGWVEAPPADLLPPADNV